MKRSERVYLESYTSILMVPKERLVSVFRTTSDARAVLIEIQEAFYGKEVITATRETVELESDDILKDADKVDVSFLVVGDPLGFVVVPRGSIEDQADEVCSATTHSDLLLRAADLNIPTEVIHNASILTALGGTGLQMYNFGQTLSLVFYTETWKPSSWYDRLEENLRIGMHTLVLVDIKVREQSEENMARRVSPLIPNLSIVAADIATEVVWCMNHLGSCLHIPPFNKSSIPRTSGIQRHPAHHLRIMERRLSLQDHHLCPLRRHWPCRYPEWERRRSESSAALCRSCRSCRKRSLELLFTV